jgi:ATP-dependent Clp protease protease subunit
MTNPAHTPGVPNPGLPSPGWRPGVPSPGERPASPWPLVPGGEPADGRGEWLYRQLLQRRIVLAQGTLDDALATVLCAQLLTLDAESEEMIQLHVHTPDGELGATFTVLDALDVLRVPVHAIAVGAVGGPCVALFAAAAERRAYPHAVFRLAEPRTHMDGTASEVAAYGAQHERLLDALYARLADTTGRDADALREDARHGRYLTAAEAVDYGVIQSIATR